MSTLPDFTGPGYFAGESPDGLTTVAGVPVPADVRVYWRDPADPTAADVLVAQAASAANGTWRIANLNPDLHYVVRGRKAGFDDVSVVGAVPTRTDVVTATGSFTTNADKNGVDGSVLIEGGLPPYSVAQIDPLPFGLEPVIVGHELKIYGSSDDGGEWGSIVRVTASNGVYVDVNVNIYIFSDYDVFFDSVVALLHFDGDVVDKKGNQVIAASGLSFVNNNEFGQCAKFSYASNVYFADKNYFNFLHSLKESFTVELFAKNSTTSSANRYLLTNGANSNEYGIGIYLAGNIISVLLAHGTIGKYPVLLSTGMPLSETRFMHIAYCFDKSQGRHMVFIDGVLRASSFYGTESNNYATNSLSIASLIRGSQNYSYDGYVDELRITKGIARYVANFDKPIAPYPDK